MTEVTRDMAIMTYLLAFPLQCFYCDQKIGSCLLLSSARCATPGERGQKLRHGILVEGSSMHLSKSNINWAWKHLLLMNRSSFWGTWDNWDSDTEASLQKTNSAELLSLFNTAIVASYRTSMFQIPIIRVSSKTFEISRLSKIHRDHLSANRAWHSAAMFCAVSQAGTAGKPNWSPSAYHESSTNRRIHKSWWWEKQRFFFQMDGSNCHVNDLSQQTKLQAHSLTYKNIKHRKTVELPEKSTAFIHCIDDGMIHGIHGHLAPWASSNSNWSPPWLHMKPTDLPSWTWNWWKRQHA